MVSGMTVGFSQSQMSFFPMAPSQLSSGMILQVV